MAVTDLFHGKTTNKQMQRTADPRCSFVSRTLFGRWIRSQSPFPAAVGDLDRWASSIA